MVRTGEERPEDDPVVPVRIWYPYFHDFRLGVVSECPDLYGWLREHRPDLYAQVKAVEKKIDDIDDARLSEITKIGQEWRELILRGEFEWKRHERNNKPHERREAKQYPLLK